MLQFGRSASYRVSLCTRVAAALCAPSRASGTVSVVLTANLGKSGVKGEQKEVATGYFRNYLQPRGLALYATPQNIAAVGPPSEAEIQALQRERATRQASKRLARLAVQLWRQEMPSGRMHAPVSAVNVVEKLKKQHRIEMREDQIEMPGGTNIETYGTHVVRVRVIEGTDNGLPMRVVVSKR